MNIYCDTTRYIWEVLEQGEYSYLFDNLTVLDVGCNIGAFSIWIYPRASLIHAVDVNTNDIENLQKTIRENNLGKIRPYCCAIAGKDGTRRVTDGSYPGGGGSMFTESANNSYEADAYSLGSFMKRNGIDRADVMKLDVEGAEYEILQAPDFPRDKIFTIIGEWHDGTLGNIFRNLGYTYREDGNHFIARR